MNRYLVLIRHAHRETDQGREKNNGLSTKGLKQAQRLSKRLTPWIAQRAAKAGTKAPGVQLISSPALRCQETLAPLAKALKCKIALEPRLGEDNDVSGRAQVLLSQWRLAVKDGPAARVTVWSSHGDLLPVVFGLAIGREIEFRKGAYAVLSLSHERAGGRIELYEFQQKVR